MSGFLKNWKYIITDISAVSYAYFSLGTSPNNARKSTPCVRRPSMFVLAGSLDKLQISYQLVTNRMKGWAFKTLNVANDACPMPMLGHTSSYPSEDLSTTGPCSSLSQPPPVQVPRSGRPDTKNTIFFLEFILYWQNGHNHLFHRGPRSDNKREIHPKN